MNSMLERAEAGDFEIVVPRIVVEEAVRQYPDRLRGELERAEKAVRGLGSELAALGLPPPVAPDVDTEAAIARYERDLRERLSSTGCEIAEHPPGVEAAATWASTRRKPFKQDGRGLPDAFVWLTVLDKAQDDDVVLVTANGNDFADENDPTLPAPELRADLKSRGIHPGRVRLVRTAVEFAAEFVTPAARARGRAAEIIRDPRLRSELDSAVADAAAWFPAAAGDDVLAWDLGADIDELQLSAFDAADFRVLSAEVGANRSVFLTLEAQGEATLDFFVEKGEAIHLPEGSPISIYDWDWNDWFTAAQAVVPALAELEVRFHEPDRFDVSIEAVRPDHV